MELELFQQQRRQYGKAWYREFHNGRGEFINQDTYNGRTILVKMVWSDITPDSHHVEQSFSDDGGKTWEPNFIGTLTRMNSSPAVMRTEFASPGRKKQQYLPMVSAMWK